MPYFFIALLFFIGSFFTYGQSATSPYVPNIPTMDQSPKALPDELPAAAEPLEPIPNIERIEDIPGVSIITEGGNNPGRLIVNGFHNYRVKVFIDDIPYQSDPSGSYNLKYLQSLTIDHYIIKNGTSGFIELYLYTKKSSGRQFYINYQNSSLFPYSHWSSLFAQQELGIGGTLLATDRDYLSLDMVGQYHLNRYYSNYYQQDISQNRAFFGSSLNYQHLFDDYTLKVASSGSFNKTGPALMVTPVNYNSQAISIALNSRNSSFINSYLSFTRTAYHLPLDGDSIDINAALLELNYHLDQEFNPIDGNKAFYIGYGFDSGYINYNYNNSLNHAYIARFSPSFTMGYEKEEGGWGGNLMLGYPLALSNRPEQPLLLHNAVTTVGVFYQAKEAPYRTTAEAGFQRRDPNALELYFPDVSNPNLKPEYYQFYRLKFNAASAVVDSYLMAEYGIINQAILTGQRPINLEGTTHRVTTTLALEWHLMPVLNLLTDVSTTHSFKPANNTQVNDLVPKVSFNSALVYQQKFDDNQFKAAIKLTGDFYNERLQHEAAFIITPTLLFEYQTKNNLTYYISGSYYFTPYKDGYKLPVTTYGPNPDGRLDIGVKWLLN